MKKLFVDFRVFRRFWIVIAAILTFPLIGQAQVYCVRQGATGSGNGLDWNNAFPSLPSTLQRGATYYIADGSYNAYTFDDPVSGSAYITIKKATEAEHGPSAGWNSSYGDGQAVFSSTLRFQSSNWIFDGAKRDESDWFNGAAYGFKVAHNGQDKQISIENTDVDNIQVRYVHLEAIQGNLPSTTIGRYSLNMYDPQAWSGYPRAGGKFTGYVISRCFFQYGNVPFFVRAGEGVIWEYSAVADSISNSANHGEAMSAYENNNNFIIRYNKFVRVAGTAIIALTGGGGFEVYGNTIADCNTSDGFIGFSGRSSSNNKVYNNTIVRGTGYNAGTAWGSGTGNLVYNNLWIGNRTVSVQGTHDYNAYSDGNSRGEANAQINVSSSIFTDYANNDFTLRSATSPGMSLGSPYNLDLLGILRGEDGNVDRGAFEYRAGPVNLTVNAGPDLQVTLPNSANLVGSYVNLLGGVVNLNWSKVSGPGTVNFTSTSAATTSASFSSAGTYVLRLTATVLLLSVSDDVTVIVQNAPDNTAPTVTLTAPASGTVSGPVTLSANASDNIGVAGVRFFVGNTQVFDDTSSPFTHTWDSAWVPNGNYPVYAQARDSVGNVKWSATNTITVNNSVGSLPAPAVHWAFNEGGGTTSTDEISGQTLNLRNGATWAPGKLGMGLQLDGVNDRADSPNSASIDYDGNQITVAAWVKLENVNNWQQILVKPKETGAFTAPYFSWHLFAGTVSATQWRPQFQLVTTDENSVNTSSAVAVNYGEWVHLVGVYDGAAVRIYVNGVEQGSAAQSGNILRYNQPLYIGAHGQPGEFAKGVIDEVRIYSRAFSPAQVQSLYTSGSGVPLAPPTGLRISDN